MANAWAHGPAEPGLAQKEVHVWRASLDVPAEAPDALRAHLSPDERERAAAFYFEQARNHYAASRGILRALLSRYLQQPANTFAFTYTSYGKPLLPIDLKFNVSHSYGLALFAFVLGPEVGVDLERIRPEFAGQEIAERFFSADEARTLKEVPTDERARAFFRCWTRKEAFIKAHGTGLSFPLREFTVEFSAGTPARLLSTPYDPDALHRWGVY